MAKQRTASVSFLIGALFIIAAFFSFLTSNPMSAVAGLLFLATAGFYIVEGLRKKKREGNAKK